MKGILMLAVFGVIGWGIWRTWIKDKRTHWKYRKQEKENLKNK